eukprot:snap_masked-scaffold_19-processed-gene-3.13-mRNA-1 protein AED:1.00 eAED:1.00 QI:0/0/0/0/1/1/2/0/225
MSYCIKFPNKTELRDQILQKWEEYTKENNLVYDPSQIIAIEVADKSKVNKLRRRFPSSFPYETMVSVQEKFESAVEIFILLFFLFLCIPWFYLINLYMSSFVSLSRENGVFFLHTSIIILPDGLFIFRRNVLSLYPLDAKVSPVINLLFFLNCMDKRGFVIFPDIREFCEFKGFDSFGSVEKQNTPVFKRDAVSKVFFYAVGTRVSSEIIPIILKAKEEFDLNKV